MTKPRCPICQAQYKLISESENVCNEHQGWFITKCLDCGLVTFSDCVGLCMKCAKRKSKGFGPKGFNKDHRAALRSYGIEDFE